MGEASNKLGQLFVDIGLGGLGNTLKGLNSVSASFLLTKNAATQAIKPIINFGKNAMNSAVSFGQMSATLGTSLEDIQKLTAYLKTFGLGEGTIGALGNTMDMLNKVNMGIEGISGSFVVGLQRIGLDWKKYRGGTFEDMLNLVSDVQEKIKGMDRGKARVILDMIGLPKELLYAFEKGGFDLKDFYLISDEDIKRVEKLNQETQKLNDTWDKFRINITGKVAPSVSSTINDLDKALQGDKVGITKSTMRGTATLSGALLGASAGSVVPLVGTSIGFIGGGVAGLLGGDALLNKFGYGNYPNVETPQQYNIEINNQNNIYSNDAEEIAGKINNGITKEAVMDAANNAQQIQNIAGR